jgi:hypothetical protein
VAPIALQRLRGNPVGAGGAADPEVDPPREEAGEDAEVLRHLERAVVRQHHPAGAEPHLLGGGADPGDQDLGRGAGDEAAAVVLGQPVAVVPEPLRQFGEVDRVVQGPGRGRTLEHRGLVEDADSQRPAHSTGWPLAVSAISMLPRVAFE